MLYLIGTGLNYSDIGLKAIAAIQRADKVYLETYTNPFDKKKLEKSLAVSIEELPRERVENDFLIGEAKDKKIVLLVPGDPLSATTHVQLLIDAKTSKVPVKVIHNSSIVTAVAECGLSLYKFGRTTTLTSHGAKSPLDMIGENKKMGLHTLVLIDPGMPIAEAVEQLDEDRLILIIGIGTDQEEMFYESGEKLKNKKTNKPFCIVVPGKIDENEQEAIDVLL